MRHDDGDLFLQVFANERNAVIAGLASLESNETPYFATETSGLAGEMLDPATEGTALCAS